ncbi:hypothetical protein [Streptomyces sp. BF23-19]|uniref:hypothetical protein n=1 Tax=unclassified Streptomyces TaxID=2593676 RepID=UPI0034E3DC72
MAALAAYGSGTYARVLVSGQVTAGLTPSAAQQVTDALNTRPVSAALSSRAALNGLGIDNDFSVDDVGLNLHLAEHAANSTDGVLLTLSFLTAADLARGLVFRGVVDCLPRRVQQLPRRIHRACAPVGRGTLRVLRFGPWAGMTASGVVAVLHGEEQIPIEPS